jgi:alpha-L-fucosidase
MPSIPPLSLSLQTRDPASGKPSSQTVSLSPDRLAIVVVDIWTQHYCPGATDWPARMIPAWNEFLGVATKLGIQIVFASAGDDLKRWEGKPQRTRILDLPRVPMPHSSGFLHEHDFYGPWPSGCMCPIHELQPGTDLPLIDCKLQKLNPNQDPRIFVRENDLFIAAGHYVPPDLPSAIASWAQPAQHELWNLCQARGITHLLYIGDATNMCVINREFGMIQMRRLGLTSVLVRDLTNAMTYYGYNPDTKQLDPSLTPAVGTQKSVEYVEKFIGPSIDSEQLFGAAVKYAGYQRRKRNNYLPADDFTGIKTSTICEPVAVPEYEYASEQAYEDFQDIKYGVRLHWGLYTLNETDASWPLITMTHAQRQEYQQLYKSFNPQQFDADKWMEFFAECGLRMFALTTKHHEGFSLFDTKTRVKQRINWTAEGGPAIEDCDLAYSVMDTPFKRDIIKEVCDAAHKYDIKIDLYFSHPDWYDADFRMYGYSPMMTPEGDPKGADVLIPGEYERIKEFQGGKHQSYGPAHTPEQRERMMQRHRAQLEELLTNYGKIDMVCLDQWMASDLWPAMRQTMLELRKIQPDVMFRARGIGNYGDYYTAEGFIPTDKEKTNMPWYVTYALAWGSAYDPKEEHYRGGPWVLQSLLDTIPKGGNFMICIGPDKHGLFHPRAIEDLRIVGQWLKINGEGVYSTRARPGTLWKEGDHIRFTRSKDRRFIYTICLNWPGTSLALTTVKPRKGSTIHMLGSKQPLPWTQTPEGVVIKFPESLQSPTNRPCDHAWVLKIEATDEVEGE